MVTGNTPFSDEKTTKTYSKIMNYKNNLKFPQDILITQAYVSLVKSLVTDQSSRLGYEKIVKHPLFQNVDFNSLREQVPPFVPKITSVDDVSNFSEVRPKESKPNLDSLKTKTRFSGRNLPFIGFTYVQGVDSAEDNLKSSINIKDSVIKKLQGEIDVLQRKLLKNRDVKEEFECLERKLEEKTRKLESVECVRVKLEKDLAGNISECSVSADLKLRRIFF